MGPVKYKSIAAAALGLAGVVGARWAWPRLSNVWRRWREAKADQQVAATETTTGAERASAEAEVQRMSEEDFDRALDFTLRREAPRGWDSLADGSGYSDRADDLGGPTNMGVTHTEYDAWRQRRGLPPRDVREIDADEIREIYREDYWLKSGASTVDWPLNAVLFDAFVNAGGHAIAKLQQAVGAEVDNPTQTIGFWGPKTAAAVDAYAKANGVVATADVLVRGMEDWYRFLASLPATPQRPSQARNLKGWLARMDTVRSTLLA